MSKQVQTVPTIQYRDYNTGELCIIPYIPGKTAYQSAVEGGYTKSEDDFYRDVANVETLSIGGATQVICDCTYDEVNNQYILTKKIPSQQTGDLFSVKFLAPNSYIAGATFLLDGDTFVTRYVDTDLPVAASSFQNNTVVTLDFSRPTLGGGGG